jgi:hypothetical protein
VCRPSLVVPVLVTAMLMASCGGDDEPSGTAAPAPVRPALAEAPKGPGEVIVRGEASPASHGPFRFDGRYTVRFEQIAPEDPGMDFAAQTPFVASADRRAEVEDGGSVRLFGDAARAGETEVTLHGRLYIDVSFGDFPYAIRLTPAG